MYANESEYNWNNNLQRQLIAFLISSVLVLSLLLIPIRLHFDALRQDTSLEVELIHSIEPKQEQIKPKSKIQSELEPVIKSIEKIIKSVKLTVIKKDPPKIIKSQPSTLSRSIVILNTYRNRKDYREIDQDFKKVTDDEQDFKIKTIKPSKIYQVSKYLNEEIDKPQTKMNHKVDGNFVSTVKFLQRLTGGIYDSSEKQYVDCDLEVENIPDWQCL